MTTDLDDYFPNFFAFAVHSCEVKGCQNNVVLDGNFDNNRECCMAKTSGCLKYDSLPGEITTGCTKTPKLGQRFYKDHCQDHQELDRNSEEMNLEDAVNEFGTTLGPVLRSAQKKTVEKQWGQVAAIMDKKSLRNRTFYKVCLL